ncbi:3-dehydroquinate synthase [Anaeromyxobacter paludicola]|uniref:3-dehydroquinate synthase n=1 Tax=Anaeromyxobacter paludicola TaxID=2918171 RepID=A0ABM7XCJ3_9BACT|nr:3-dehydroquinate synthase family protein [Anaeromyxobacter paludicola]BDG09550.1 3-dehydroquinate synthase [Anaeromyxobacter paludicola]
MSIEILEARQEGREYPVCVGKGAAAAAAELASERDAVALVTAAPVRATPLVERLERQLARTGRLALVHVLPDGEKGKRLAEIERAAQKLLRAGLTRRSLVIAAGGGAVTDAAGFLAATFMRGVDWLAVPTTLLGMVDAALGGKTAVNLPAAKNIVGAFHPPMAVLMDPAGLATLPFRELRSGFGEVLKYAALRPSLLPAAARAAARGKADAGLVAECARIKLEVVARDPFERGERKLLNLGHTFGHGVEAAGGFRRYTHGEAVAVGLAFAFRLAARMGRVGAEQAFALDEALAGAGLPVRVPSAVARKAAALMATDKKRTAAGLRWVLPQAVGESWGVEWDVEADPAALRAALADIAEGT